MGGVHDTASSASSQWARLGTVDNVATIFVGGALDEGFGVLAFDEAGLVRR